jgi:tetratricopeptide (TPR) repeat protein
MDQDRWRRVNNIFHAALERRSSERQSYVILASGGDPEIQAEVEFLLRADQDAGSYLESPLLAAEQLPAAVSPLNPDDMLCGRFRILHAIAEGGMGHVFEAFDSELAVHLALKVIRPEIASNPEALARFRQEVRLARQITHPNVCRTFDIERETRLVDAARGITLELVFLTMEFLPGETLAARIKREGALALGEALDLARQIADALQAAHALGIVHRDMKPGNIMLVPAEARTPLPFRAVVTDFGLARLDPIISSANSSATSHTNRPIGTLAYMAPEQLENAAVSPVTDIYAFGLILFEMVTGTRAFPSGSFLSGVAMRLNGPPPSPQALVPNLPAPWIRAIEGCLRIKPSDRFHSAADVMAVLDGNRVTLPRVGKGRLRAALPFASWPPVRRFSALAGILLAVVALFAGGLRLYRLGGDARVNPGALVYLTQVKNQTGEKSFDNLTELIHAGLTQSAQINLLDQGRAGDILQQMTKAPDTVIDAPIAREIAMRAGAVRVVFATVTKSAGSYSLNVDIQQPDNTPTRYRDHWTRSFEWHTSGSTTSSGVIPPELLTAIRTSSDWIRLEVGESANDIARLDVPPEDVTTSNWDALTDFVRSEELQRRQASGEAIASLQESVRLDPGFSLAWARLGDLLVGMNRNTEGYRAYSRALDLNQDQRLTRRERDRIQGAFALDSCDFQTAEQAFRDYSLYYESDYRGWYYRGYPLRMLGRNDEAIASLKKAYALDSTRTNAPWELARSYINLGNYRETLKWAQILENIGDRTDAFYFRGVVLFLNGNYSDAQSSISHMKEASRPAVRSWGYGIVARFLAETGDYREAVSVLNEGIEQDRSLGDDGDLADKLADRAYIDAVLADSDKCADDLTAALAVEASPQRIILASHILGFTLRNAHGAPALRLNNLLNDLPNKLPREDFGEITRIARLRVRGEIFLANHRWSEAVEAFRKASDLDAPIAPREYLGRALEIAAAHSADQVQVSRLRDQAIAAYAFTALHPGVFWMQDGDDPPGSYGDQLLAYLNLVIAQHKSDRDTPKLLLTLSALRKQQLQPYPELNRALADTVQGPNPKN